ncbi:hypothetical protein VKT23_020438 [Stygiomarasmius scandens]|uniref:Mating-type protein MAT-1 n=1 Tax=Marasmiellus scandens TaxID=2682957 RepID=A0ABR1IJ17_9AGAR
MNLFDVNKAVLPDVENFHLIKQPARRIQPGPLSDRSPTSTVASFLTATERAVAKRDKAILKDLIQLDGLSFVTGSAVRLRQVCHLINAVRPRTGATAEEKLRLKERREDIEKRLTIANFSRGPFDLEGRPNKILLIIHEHWGFDMYASYAICPHPSRLNVIIKHLQDANNKWDQAVRKDPSAARIINFDPILANMHWIILVLRPLAFLPPDESMLFSTWRDIVAPPSSEQWQRCFIDYTQQPISPYLVVRDRSGATSFLKDGFTVPSLRVPSDAVSVFAMITNAYTKIISLGDNLHPELHDIKLKLDTLMHLIFYMPSDFLASEAHVLATVEHRDVDMVSITPTQSSIHHPQTSQNIGQSSNNSSDSHHGQLMPPGLVGSTSLSPCHLEDFVSVDAPPDPPEKPQSNGLTLLEMDTLKARAYDMTLPPDERIQATVQWVTGTPHFRKDGDESDDDEEDETDYYYPEDLEPEGRGCMANLGL